MTTEGQATSRDQGDPSAVPDYRARATDSGLLADDPGPVLANLSSEHLTAEGVFKSDKYDWCPEGFFALKFTDRNAWLPLRIYASMLELHQPSLGEHAMQLATDIRMAVQKAQDDAGILSRAADPHEPAMGQGGSDA